MKIIEDTSVKRSRNLANGELQLNSIYGFGTTTGDNAGLFIITGWYDKENLLFKLRWTNLTTTTTEFFLGKISKSSLAIKSDGILKSATGESKKMTLRGNRNILNFEVESDTLIACFCDHEDGLFTDSTGYCEVCNEACLTCQGPTASDCLTCKPKPMIKGILRITQIPSSGAQGKGHCSVICKNGFYVKSNPD